MKRSQPLRDWSAAREKVEREGHCRVMNDPVTCVPRSGEDKCGWPLEAAHIVGREHDKKQFGMDWDLVTGQTIWHVDPDRIVPLCLKHHRMYDRHELDLLPYLTVEEQAQAVLDAGGIELARRRTAPLVYRLEAA